jgi:serine/threonine protein kinase
LPTDTERNTSSARAEWRSCIWRATAGTNDDELLYYVMRFVEGESLRQRLQREKQLPLSEAIRLAAEVADALDYAHRQTTLRT